jgi:N-acetylglucosaminyldiphosphoundecaprenol N-acetyl-beta-D-mannosaminyltransferase
MKEMNMARKKVLGTSFDSIGMAALLKSVDEDIQRGIRFRIAFINPEFVVEARANPRLSRYLETCRYNLPDGVGILWAYKQLHSQKMPERVTGTDFVPSVCRLASAREYALFFLGGAQGVAEKAKHTLEKMVPGVKIVGVMHGYDENSEDIVGMINRSGADILMVCTGNPRQEEWIERHFERLTAKMVFGNGGALDFWSGAAKRAPQWMIGLNLEWLYRLMQDRSWKRLRRQLRLLTFVRLVLIEKVMARNP